MACEVVVCWIWQEVAAVTFLAEGGAVAVVAGQAVAGKEGAEATIWVAEGVADGGERAVGAAAAMCGEGRAVGAEGAVAGAARGGAAEATVGAAGAGAVGSGSALAAMAVGRGAGAEPGALEAREAELRGRPGP